MREAPGHCEDWKSDITLWINGAECGTWRSPGDFGGRRGRLNPQKWPNGSSQYGTLVVWEIDEESSRLNDTSAGNINLSDLHIMDQPYLTVRIGNKPDAEYAGGFNLFGKTYGDYPQDIILTLEYV